jgi:hypothetical protein
MADTPSDPINFTAFVLGLASTTLMHLGAAPHYESGQSSANPTLARQSLSLLEMLKEKTKGNLSPDEERLFANLLTDLRLKFVELNKGK